MNKPVAWTNEKNLNNIQIGGAGYIWKLLAEKTDIPLYTHPVKELTLTKEEIHAVWASGQYYTLDKKGNVDEIRFEDFARAILRKAQEK